MPRKLSMTPQSIASRNWKYRNKSAIDEYNINYYKTHNTNKIQQKYDMKRAEYKKQVKALLRILNNLYNPI